MGVEGKSPETIKYFICIQMHAMHKLLCHLLKITDKKQLIIDNFLKFHSALILYEK